MVAPEKFAPARVAWVKDVFARFAFSISAPGRLTCVRSKPERSTPLRFAQLMSVAFEK